MTSVLKVDRSKISFDGPQLKINDSQSLKNLNTAGDLLRSNEVVAFPTETVYGLGANCLSTEAVSKIYTAKNRPSDNPLIIHISSKSQVKTILKTSIPEIYQPLIEKFWPGPLTILLPITKETPISQLCTKGQNTFGCRIPSHPVARALIELSGVPVAAPSANASTRPSCTEAQHVLQDMDGRIPLIIDGGSSDVGVESTVVDGLSTPPRILRPGGVSLEMIRTQGGPEWQSTISEVTTTIPKGVSVKAPGMKYKHYSPSARVILINASIDLQKLASGFPDAKNVALLTTQYMQFDSFADKWPNKTTNFLDLPLGRTKREMSHNLFSRFREADLANADYIFVEAVDTADEGLAIMNRLNKAAEEHII